MQMERSVKFDLMEPPDEVLSVPNNRNHKAQSKDRLEISIRFDADDELLHAVETSDAVMVELSTSKTYQLLDGVKGLMVGENDYAMWGLDNEGAKSCIWFW